MLPNRKQFVARFVICASRTAKHEEAVSRLKHRRRELFFEAGAEDEAEFRHRAVQHARADVLLKDKNTLKR